LQRLAFPGHVPPMASALDGFTLTLKNASGTSNPFLLTYARAPVVVDAGDNDTRERAQKVPVPCEIAGRIEKKADVDWYTFTVEKGQAITIEVLGERLGAPLDLYFQLVSEKGAVVTEQDDTPEPMTPYFSARTDDPPRYRFVAPADTTYYLKVSSRAASTDAGPRHRYVVRIGPDEPDFHVIAMPPSTTSPDSAVLGAFGSYAFNVLVWRLGGFTGDITLTGETLPPGLSVRPQVLANGQKQAVVVVSATEDAPAYTGAIKLIGRAVIGGQKVEREVRAANIVWPVPQANIVTITRLDRELVLAVRGQAPYSLTTATDKISVQQGEKISIPVKMLTHLPDFKGTVQLSAAGLPPGLNLPPLSLAPGKDATAVLDSKGGGALPPGHYTIVLRGQTQPPNPKGAPPGMKGPSNYVQVTPPIALTVIPKQLGKLTVAPAQAKVQPGKTLELMVKFARQYDLGLPLKVEAVLPDNVKGVSAKGVTMEPNQDEVKLAINVEPNVPPNTALALTVRATAMFDTVPVIHEAKVSVNVGK
jgi:hypothetical protein